MWNKRLNIMIISNFLNIHTQKLTASLGLFSKDEKLQNST